MCSNLAAKVVLITGAGSGIAAATAQKFGRLGAQLVLTDIEAECLLKTRAQCTCCNVEPFLLEADITHEPDVKCLYKNMIAKCKRLDILVNAAGIMERGTIECTSLEQFDRTMRTNLRSMYHLSMLCTPHLIESKGNIVNVSSVCGLRVFPNILAYNISKAGVDQLTRSVALELGPKGVRCNAVNPGVIRTNLQKSGGMSEEQYVRFLEHSKTTHAIGRVGEPHEVANVICFLASNLASFITGVTLPVDGGKQLICPR